MCLAAPLEAATVAKILCEPCMRKGTLGGVLVARLGTLHRGTLGNLWFSGMFLTEGQSFPRPGTGSLNLNLGTGSCLPPVVNLGAIEKNGVVL